MSESDNLDPRDQITERDVETLLRLAREPNATVARLKINPRRIKELPMGAKEPQPAPKGPKPPASPAPPPLKRINSARRQAALEHLLEVAREIVANYGDACGVRQYDYIRLDLHRAVMGVNAAEG